ncbi:MAG TPA: hypothetical protein VJ256_02925 [Dehalococcoidia bacterium]|nr:hypothetical protein [Dehalococcoidia bacterium]
MSRLWLFGAAACAIALLAGGIAVALVTGGRGEDLLPADLPEGVVQRYLRAIAREDYREAYDYFSADLQGRCSYDQFLRWASSSYFKREIEEAQVTLESARIDGDRAQVRLRFTQFDPGVPFFGAGEHSYERTFHLRLEGEQWRFGTIPEGPGACARF